ncbi:MAG: hypothetical protein ACPGQD_01925 [Planctomycetota bacterium]
MARGVEFPLRITPRGGLAMTDTNIASLLALELLPSTTANPFDHRDGLVSPDYTWEADDRATRALIRQRVEQIFARFEAQGRARLDSLTFASVPGTGALRPIIAWTDLETGQTDGVALGVDDG